MAKIVSLEAAKLLKQLGFDMEVSTVYFRNKRKKIGWDTVPEFIVKHNANEWPYSESQISAPTIYEADEWLLRRYGIKIVLLPFIKEALNDFEDSVFVCTNDKKYFMYNYKICFTDDAIAAGLEKRMCLTEPFLIYLRYNHRGSKFPIIAKPRTEVETFESALKIIGDSLLELNKKGK